MVRCQYYMVRPLHMGILYNLIRKHIMKNYHIGEYYIVLERNPVNGSVSVSAIPDSGNTIRRTFYGYTTKEMKREIAAMVRLGF